MTRKKQFSISRLGLSLLALAGLCASLIATPAASAPITGKLKTSLDVNTQMPSAHLIKRDEDRKKGDRRARQGNQKKHDGARSRQENPIPNWAPQRNKDGRVQGRSSKRDPSAQWRSKGKQFERQRATKQSGQKREAARSNERNRDQARSNERKRNTNTNQNWSQNRGKIQIKNKGHDRSKGSARSRGQDRSRDQSRTRDRARVNDRSRDHNRTKDRARTRKQIDRRATGSTRTRNTPPRRDNKGWDRNRRDNKKWGNRNYDRQRDGRHDKRYGYNKPNRHIKRHFNNGHRASYARHKSNHRYGRHYQSHHKRRHTDHFLRRIVIDFFYGIVLHGWQPIHYRTYDAYYGAECFPVIRHDYWYGRRAKLGGVMCIDRYGDAYLIEDSLYAIRYY